MPQAVMDQLPVLIWGTLVSLLLVLSFARGIIFSPKLTPRARIDRRDDRDLVERLRHRERRKLTRMALKGDRIEDPDQNEKAGAACRIALAGIEAGQGRRWTLPLFGTFFVLLFLPPSDEGEARVWFLLGLALQYVFLSMLALPALWRVQKRHLIETARVNRWPWELQPEGALVPVAGAVPGSASMPGPSAALALAPQEHCGQLPGEFRGRSVSQIPQLVDSVRLVSADYEAWVSIFECSMCGQRWQEAYEGKGRRKAPSVRKIEVG